MSVPLTLYTRTGCHLCDDMEQVLKSLSGDMNIAIGLVLVDGDAELEKLYGDKVPVLAMNDEIICEYYLDKVALTEAISRYVVAQHP